MPARPPNLLLILADDLGFDDLGLHGNPHVLSPRLDALGRASVRFSDFTVNPVCAPSRATLLTGRHFLRTGVSHVHGGKDFLHLDERTLADHLRAAGYATGLWGKWHLGHTEGYHPWQRGFDEAWSAQLYRHRDARGARHGTPIEPTGWADAVMADQAIDFIRRHQDRPFFAFLPTMTPHGPFDAPDEWIAPYREQGLSPALATLWGMVSHLDHQIGRVLDTLDELGLAENTIVVFLSDNGPAFEAERLSDDDRRRRGISGRRGWKGDLYENGVRSPLFVRWGSRWPARTVDLPLDLTGLTPTLLDLLGVAPLASAPAFDGRSFRAVLDQPDAAFQPAPIFNYAHRGWLTSGPPYSLTGVDGEYRPLGPGGVSTLPLLAQSLSVRQGPFKLLLNPDYATGEALGRTQLVNLTQDPGETTALDDAEPARHAELLAAARAWWQATLQAPHAFAPPVLRLAPGSSRVPATVPSALAGHLVNTVTDLRGWQAAGDVAIYDVEVTVLTHLALTPIWREPPAAGWLWSWSAAGHTATTDGVQPAQLTLPTGRWPLELRLVAAPPDAPPLALRLLAIEAREAAPATGSAEPSAPSPCPVPR